ncbi:diacylglycerol O-acyltransferase 1 [Coemansia sp. IMI 203386]|nr:diacylglycerol O-acyltransferase 1 [Coemansia sp. IMI 203386]
MNKHAQNSQAAIVAGCHHSAVCQQPGQQHQPETNNSSNNVDANSSAFFGWALGLPVFAGIQKPENGYIEACRTQLVRIGAFVDEATTTVMVTLWTTSPVLCLFLYLYLLVNFKSLRTLLLVYLVFCLFDPRPYDGVGRRVPSINKLPIWDHVNRYFKPRMIFEEHLDASRKYVFGSHPHGVISYTSQLIAGTTGLGIESHFPGLVVRGVTMPATFCIPFFRDYALAMGCLSCDRDSIRAALSERRHKIRQSLLIVIGGAQESMLAHENSADLVLLKRRGFVSEAVRAGCDLVPVYNFNENSIYKLVDNPPGSLVHKFEMAIRSFFGFTILLFHGRNIFFTPYKTQLTTVVGRPIRVKRNYDASAEEIDEYHRLYVEELIRLYNKYQPKYAPNSKELRFVA